MAEQSREYAELPARIKNLHDRTALNKTAEQFYAFYHHGPIGFLALDRRATILDINLVAENMLTGGQPEDLINKSFYPFIIFEQRDNLYLHLKKIFKDRCDKTCELEIRSLKDQCYNIHLHSIIASYKPNRYVANTIITDITELKNRERQLREMTTALRKTNREKEEAIAILDALFECTPLGIGFWDKELKFIRLNSALAEIDGLPVERHISRRIDEVGLKVADMDKLICTWKNILETGNPELNVEVSGVSAAYENKIRHWMVNWYPVSLDNKNIGIAATVLDITDRKQMEDDLRNSRDILDQRVKERSRDLELKTLYLEKEIERRMKYEEELKSSGEKILKEIQNRKSLEKQMVNLMERDRMDIGRTLHDEVGQLLSTVHMELDLLKRDIKSNPLEGRKTIEKIQHRLKESGKYIRDVSRWLRSDILERLGLEAAIRDLTQMCKLDNVHVHINVRKIPDNLDLETGLAVFRIVQEAITNVMRHAHARNVFVTVVKKRDVISVSVEDDGMGFEYDGEQPPPSPPGLRSDKASSLVKTSANKSARQAKGGQPLPTPSRGGQKRRGVSTLGLMIMKERAEQLGGRFWIESKPGKGTQVLAEVPVEL